MGRWTGWAGKGLIAIAGALAAALAVPAAAESPGPRPAIWLLEDEDTRIYLFGTVHVLPPGLEWRSPALERIVEESDELVMETASGPGADDFAKALGHMLLGKQVPLASRVSPDRRPALRELIEAYGEHSAAFDGLQTWAAAMMLSVPPGLWGDGAGEPLSGVEDALTEDFQRAGRPIGEVENGPQQLRNISRLSRAAQREILEAVIDDYRAALAEEDPVDDLYASWTSGDAERVGRLSERLPPGLFEVLLTRRNRAWTDWLIDRLDRPGTVLFAVGAGHLAGRDSVQDMLAERGFEVRRID